MKRILSILFVIVLLAVALTLVSCSHKHEFTDTVIAPDCETHKAGYTEHTCSCGTTYVTDYVEAHQFTVTVVPATCHDIGYTEHVCDLCEYLKRDYFTDLDDSNHVFFYPADYEDEEKAGKPNLVETVASTCKDYGYSTYACIYCNAEAKFEITPELAEHTFEEWNILSKPTCTKEGFKERTCTLCGAIEQTKIAVSGHVWSEYEVVVDNIHLNALYQERTCIDCATTEAHPEIIEDVLALELRENANGKYYVVKNMNPGKNCTTIVVPEFMYLNGEKVSVTEIKSNAFMNNVNIEVLYISKSITKIGTFAFSGCTGLKTINYDGTMAQWNSINKVDGWSYGAGVFTVVCSDGVITQ